MASVPRAKRVDEAVVSASLTGDVDPSVLSFKIDRGHNGSPQNSKG
jgi:hypothetical protein